MKKIVSFAAALLFTVLLVACGGGNKMADGVYTAQVDDAFVEAYGHGWREVLQVTFKDGKIVDAVYDGVNADGQRKSEPGVYEMDPSPIDWLPKLEQNIINNADGKVDAVAGATSSSSNAEQLLKAIMQNGKPGETITVSITPAK